MITALVLLNLGTANWAKLDSALFLSPAFELVIDGLLTSLALVKIVAALEADFCLAKRTLDHFVVKCLSTGKPFAARFGTPTH